MNDCGDALNACHLLGSGVTVVSGNGTSQLTLEGSIADINAYLLNGNLLWNPDGANNHEMGLLKIEIDDNGCLPGGNVVCSTVLISEICNPDFSCDSVNDFSQVNFTNIGSVCAGGGNDEITTSFSHQGATTTYDGGSGNDTIHLLFTPDQLAEILADPQMRCDLRSFVNDPCGETLDLCGSSWNAKAQNFEHADVNLVSGNGSGIVANLNGLTPDAEFIIGSCGDNTLSGCLNKSNVIVGLDGNDQLTGGTLSDVLLGGAGNDILIGGLGNDVLSGSTGANTFKFLEMSGTSANFGKDIIVDFQLGHDTIDIDHSLFANFAALQAAISEDCHGNAVITADCSNTITLAGVSAAAIVAHHADIHLV
jgi:Ca2+-binding RTX toxin-like protein